jgi:hypothetical protein
MDEINSAQRLQLDVLEEEYRRRHGVAVEWLKAEIGEGDVFENDVARALLSEKGAWFECIDLPMEFSGAAGGPCDHRFISDNEMTALTETLRSIAEEEPGDGLVSFSLLVLYGRSGVADDRAAFVYQMRRGGDGELLRPVRAGAIQPERMPRLVRCSIDLKVEIQGIPLRRGVIVCLGGIGERNLLVLMQHEGMDVRNLGAQEAGALPN